MRESLLLVLLLFVSLASCKLNPGFSREDVEDNDFADFEEFEEFDDETGNKEEVIQPAPAPSGASKDSDEEETAVEDEDDGSEFEHFQDEEEFEGYDADRPSRTHGSKGPVPEIKIAKVPMYMNSKWDSYVLEILILSGLTVYILNFMMGRAKNAKIAQAWFAAHRQILEDNFALVGDDGKKELAPEGCGMIKESEHVYTLWCSGRVCCEGMLVELKLIKRQDLVSMISQFFKKTGDMVEIKVQMGVDDLDTFVMFAGQKRTATKMSKEMNDLVTYGGEKRAGERYGLPPSFFVLSEIGEGTTAVLDARTQALVAKYPELVEYIHVSDQFSGPKQPDDAAGQQAAATTRLPDGRRVVKFGINFPSRTPGGAQVNLTEIESMKPVLLLVFYLVDKLKRFKLSKESKQKAEKNRSRVEESFLKTTHQVRAEAAAARREEKRRAEKERIMAEEDPEKQRRWEEKESRRQMKKKQPRIKQLKVKAL